MISKIFSNSFPNNLRIARRKVENEKNLEEIKILINKIEKVKNNQNIYLKKYLNSSKLIGKN